MRQKSKIHQFGALALAMLMFFTSTGFLVDAHFCQDQLKRISIIGKAKTCQEVAACQKKCGIKAATSCHPEDEAHTKKGCCSNESTFVKYDGDFPVISSDIVPDLQELTTFTVFFYYLDAFQYIVHHSVPDLTLKNKFLVHSVDIYVRLQRFLC